MSVLGRSSHHVADAAPRMISSDVSAAGAERTRNFSLHAMLAVTSAYLSGENATMVTWMSISSPGSSKPQLGVVENMVRAVVRILKATRCPSTLMRVISLLTACSDTEGSMTSRLMCKGSTIMIEIEKGGRGARLASMTWWRRPDKDLTTQPLSLRQTTHET